MRRRILAPLLLILLIIMLVVFVRWVFGRPEVGPPFALCPGPDAYGYTCQTSATLAYVDATVDVGLLLDDGGVTIELPFDFAFYGSVYDRVYASSNGNLQFSRQNPIYANVCLDQGPAAGFGEMLAPYWDDLNLTFVGLLETETLGSAPERVFVIEWDGVASFANAEETVTFEVQFFEGSNNIAFLYEEVSRSEGDQGSSATIGLQSESQGIALQFGCNQSVIQDGSTILFAHPQDQADQETAVDILPVETELRSIATKGDVAFLAEYLDRFGPEALPRARAWWLSQTPQRDSQWQWADTTGDGLDELIFLWRPVGQYAFQSQVAVMEMDHENGWRPLWVGWPVARQDGRASPLLLQGGDLTGDGAADVVLGLRARGRLIVASQDSGTWAFYEVPGKCRGSAVLRDVSGDGVLDIVRGRCGDSGRQANIWTGTGFE